MPITLPPLRERREDIAELVRFFLQRFSLETKNRVTDLARDAEDRLLGYDWPGNVRELANVSERAVVFGAGSEVTLRDLPARIVAAGPTSASDGVSYRQALEVARREAITRALAQSQGNHTAAARALGIHKTHLLKLMKALGID